MNRLLAPSMAGLLALLAVAPSWGQKPGSTGSNPSRPPAGTAPSSPGQPMGPSQPSPQMQMPLYVNGRVLLNTGQPVPEPVSVQLDCGLRVLQVIRTDLKGYFQFVLGAGPQSNIDLSAADDTPSLAGSGMNGMNGMGASNSRGFGSSGDLTGCDLRVSVDGYRPLVNTISGPPDLGQIDVGTFHLTRIAGVQGSAISVTSMMVPNNARKEFEKGENDARNNKVNSATEHFEKAVAAYDNYAAAWNELGRMYVAGNDGGQALQAFTKAIAADQQYIPPYLNLASLQLEAQEYSNAISTAGKVLALNPGVDLANYLQAVGYLHLQRLDEAEKSARAVEDSPRQAFPQVHALLAEIFMEKRDYPSAAGEIRAYLKQSPKSPVAADMKNKLEQIEPAAAAAEANSKTSSPQAQVVQ